MRDPLRMRPTLRLGAALLLCFALPATADQHATQSETEALDQFLAEDDPDIEDRRISLEEAIGLALINNLDIQISRTGPAIAEQQERAARGAFDVNAAASFQFNHSETPTSNQLTQNLPVISDDWDYQAGLNGVLPLGARYSTQVNLTRGENESPIESLERRWETIVRNEVTLPLLRGLFDNEANIGVKRSALQTRISLEDFRNTLILTIQGVENSYWGLSTALAQDRVAQKSLKRARDLLEQTQIQFDVGVVSKVEVAQAQAGVAEREFNAVATRNALNDQRDALLDSTYSPAYSSFRKLRLEPDEPTYIEFAVDEPTAIEIALNTRPIIVSARQRVEQAELGVDLAKNNRLPQLDVVGSYQMQAISGKFKPPCQTLFLSDDDRMTCNMGGVLPTPPELGSANNSTEDFFRKRGTHSWGVGGRFSIPLGNTTARANVAESEITLHRTRRELARTRQNIVIQVRQAVRALRSAEREYRAAQRRFEAESESLRAEQERLRLGDSTPFRVLEVEEDLVEAETQVNVSLRRLRAAITGIESAQGTLLEARGISIDAELER